MDEFEKTTLLRTKHNVLKNLDRINDAIESSETPIQDHMVLDDIKDSLKSLKCVRDILCTVPDATKTVPKTVPGMV